MSSDQDSSGRTGTAARWRLRLDARRSLPDVIEDKLRELIDSGELPPGDRLPNEPELARRMEVARSSVRTALQRLEVLGVVEVQRGRGWFVRRKPKAEPQHDLVDWMSERRFRLSELLEVRMALEGMAASLAAARASDGEIDDIAKLSQDHHDARRDVEARVRSGEAFHDAVVRASHNEALRATYHLLLPELTELRRRMITGSERTGRWGTGHDHVVQFLKRRDSAGARAAMVNHLFELYDDVVQLAGEQDMPEPPIHYTDVVSVADEPDWPSRPASAD